MELIFAPNSHEWLSNRWRYLGSSDFPVVIGLSPYAMPKDLLAYKRLADKAEPTDQTAQMKAGHDNEEPIAAAIATKMGWELELGRQFQRDYHASTIDRFILPEREILEIKYKSYKLPPRMPTIDHVAQVQHQMFVMQKTHAYIGYGRPESAEYKLFKLAFNREWWDSFAEPRFTEFRAKWVSEEDRALSYGNEHEKWGPNRVRTVFAPILVHAPIAVRLPIKKRTKVSKPTV